MYCCSWLMGSSSHMLCFSCWSVNIRKTTWMALHLGQSSRYFVPKQWNQLGDSKNWMSHVVFPSCRWYNLDVKDATGIMILNIWWYWWWWWYCYSWWFWLWWCWSMLISKYLLMVYYQYMVPTSSRYLSSSHCSVAPFELQGLSQIAAGDRRGSIRLEDHHTRVWRNVYIYICLYVYDVYFKILYGILYSVKLYDLIWYF